VFTVLSFLSFSAFSLEVAHKMGRRPAAAVEEEVLTVPLDKNLESTQWFAEDDAGIMKGMRDSLDGWEKKEEYAKVWDLKSTGNYNTPATAQKRKFIAARMLKYADKRLAGEMKTADAGSALHTIGKAEKSLRPNASVPVSRYVSLKFKARVLQGKASVEVKNPWIELSTTIAANGKTKVVSKREFASIGFTTGAEYEVNTSGWVAYADQQVTKNIKTRLSSTQDRGEAMFSNDADAKLEMTASFPFNL
jgi:hypothetical protein